MTTRRSGTGCENRHGANGGPPQGGAPAQPPLTRTRNWGGDTREPQKGPFLPGVQQFTCRLGFGDNGVVLKARQAYCRHAGKPEGAPGAVSKGHSWELPLLLCTALSRDLPDFAKSGTLCLYKSEKNKLKQTHEYRNIHLFKAHGTQITQRHRGSQHQAGRPLVLWGPGDAPLREEANR